MRGAQMTMTMMCLWRTCRLGRIASTSRWNKTGHIGVPIYFGCESTTVLINCVLISLTELSDNIVIGSQHTSDKYRTFKVLNQGDMVVFILKCLRAYVIC